MEGNLLAAHRDDPQVQAGLVTREWKHGLCGCFDNCGMCIIAYFVPCVTFGQTAEVRGKSCCCWGCLAMVPIVHLVLAVQQRGDIRQIRGIPGSCCGDLMCNILCPFCVLVQERQESEHIKTDLIQILAAKGNQAPGAPVMDHGGGYGTHHPGHQPAGAYPPQAGQYVVGGGYDQPNTEPAPPYSETDPLPPKH